MEVDWVSVAECDPPHGVSHPDHAIELANQFAASGWDPSCPALVGYPWQGRIQLLSGSHRWIAAGIAGIQIPVVIVPFKHVDRCWGDLRAWATLMRMGDPGPTPRSSAPASSCVRPRKLAVLRPHAPAPSAGDG